MRRLDIDSPRQHRIAVDGFGWSVWEWPGEGDPLFFVHATGFHAQCWRRVIAHFPGRRVLAVDMPNHGSSDRQPTPFVWLRFARGLGAVWEHLGLQGITGVGHSMGGHVLTLATANWSERVKGLVLVDPVIVDPVLADQRRGKVAPEDNPVARRRNHWQSAQQMQEAFRDRKPFCDWDPEVLRDYCAGGLRERADGDGYELACAPLDEAHVYASSMAPEVYTLVREIQQPVQVIRGKLWDPTSPPGDFSNSPTWPALALQFPSGIDDFHPTRSHFFPMETPDWLAERIRHFEQSQLSSH